MSRSDNHELIARGRKAGLSTRELYAALAGRPPEGVDQQPGTTDENGYVSEFNEQGQRVYRPVSDETH
jgi:hypothetical protein